jgi:hypothetical protein
MREFASDVESPVESSGEGPEATVRGTVLAGLVEGLHPAIEELAERIAREAWAVYNATLWRALGAQIVSLELFGGGYLLGTDSGDCMLGSSVWAAPPVNPSLPPQAPPRLP